MLCVVTPDGTKSWLIDEFFYKIFVGHDISGKNSDFIYIFCVFIPWKKLNVFDIVLGIDNWLKKFCFLKQEALV